MDRIHQKAQQEQMKEFAQQILDKLDERPAGSSIKKEELLKILDGMIQSEEQVSAKKEPWDFSREKSHDVFVCGDGILIRPITPEDEGFYCGVRMQYSLMYRAAYNTAKENKKKVAISLVTSAAICAFVCGVTEPCEFGFMFLAPVLYVIYAVLYGIFTAVTTIVGFRAGFSFSAGATDLIFSASLPGAAKTWMIIPLGIAAFVVFYLVFRFAIVAFDFKTPGREDDDLEADKSAVLSNNNFTDVAKIVLEGLGGKENVKSLDNCITRLRLEINDYTKIDEAKIKSAGVAGVMRPSKNAVQVIVGTKVQFVADEMKKMLK